MASWCRYYCRNVWSRSGTIYYYVRSGSKASLDWEGCRSYWTASTTTSISPCSYSSTEVGATIFRGFDSGASSWIRSGRSRRRRRASMYPSSHAAGVAISSDLGHLGTTCGLGNYSRYSGRCISTGRATFSTLERAGFHYNFRERLTTSCGRGSTYSGFRFFFSSIGGWRSALFSPDAWASGGACGTASDGGFGTAFFEALALSSASSSGTGSELCGGFGTTSALSASFWASGWGCNSYSAAAGSSTWSSSSSIAGRSGRFIGFRIRVPCIALPRPSRGPSTWPRSSGSSHRAYNRRYYRVSIFTKRTVRSVFFFYGSYGAPGSYLRLKTWSRSSTYYR